MAKPFPDSVPLKKAKCPTCGNPLEAALRKHEDVVRAGCTAPGCTYSVDLYWLGGGTVSPN